MYGAIYRIFMELWKFYYQDYEIEKRTAVAVNHHFSSFIILQFEL